MKSLIIKDILVYSKRFGFIFWLFAIALLTRLNVNNVYIIDLLGVLALMVFASKVKIDSFGNLLLLFSIMYSGTSFINSTVSTNFENIGYLVCPLAFYVFGKRIVQVTESNRQLLSLLLLIVFLSSVDLYILIIRDVQEFGLINVYRSIGGEGSDNSVATATLLGLVASLGFGGLSYCLMETKPLRSWISWIFIFCTILSLLSVIHLLNRTGIVVCASVVICVLLYKVNGSIKQVIPALIFLLVIYLILSQLGIINNEVLDAYEARNLGEEGTGSANGRFDRWIDACTLMFQHPTGWSKMQGALYCHSLWFDVARVTGILPFSLLLYMSFKGALFTKRLIAYKSNIVVGVFLGFTVCMYLSAAMEPVLEGASSYFYLMCLFWGLQNEYYNNYNRINNEI